MPVRVWSSAPSMSVGLHEEVCLPLCVWSLRGVALVPTQPEATTSLVQVRSQAPLQYAHEVHIAEHLLGM